MEVAQLKIFFLDRRRECTNEGFVISGCQDRKYMTRSGGQNG